MGFVSDAGSAVDVEVNSKLRTTLNHWTERIPSTQHSRIHTRRKRKPMNSPQSSFSRRCNNCGVTKTPQWREGPDGPKTLCNACGVKYSRERQDKSKPRKSKKSKSKGSSKSNGSFCSIKKRSRRGERDPSHYDIAFLFSNQSPPSKHPSSVHFGEEDGFTRKEYAAALSLASLAILGSSTSSKGDAIGETSRGMDVNEEECSERVLPGTRRRSKRIMEAHKSCTHYYGGFNFDEWVPNFMDMDEASGCDGGGIIQCCPEEGIAVGVPCVWAAMSTSTPKEFCKHHPSAHFHSIKKTNQDERFHLLSQHHSCPSSASNSAKSDIYVNIKSNDVV